VASRFRNLSQISDDTATKVVTQFRESGDRASFAESHAATNRSAAPSRRSAQLPRIGPHFNLD